ncbi:MAG: zinc ribbon domain-containing protein [Bacteroides sp.]|nr:zinc ribbon domain-containing protein [Eubacterium sp.]MCM1418886.1 zinc ribbon domain-containing protein [Roseburia sp.]MCM1463375.1 zinc ribbon domain-containing protein [Bacteroides sp.]
METIITTLIVLAIIAAAIALAVWLIKRKLNQTTRKYLGMGLGETTELIRNGLREEATAPKPIANMTAVYKPKLLRDFPETSYEEVERMAKNALLGFLTAIAAEDAGKLFRPSRNLAQQAQSRIDGNQLKNEKERFDSPKIHKISFADYKSANGTADAAFQISFEADRGGGQPEQLACTVRLNCGRAEAEETGGAVYSHTCPSCGAPVTAVGGNKVCRYCGSGLSERGTRVWLADSVTFF